MRDGGWREKRVPNPRRALRKAEEGGVASGNIRFLPVPAAGTWRVSLLCTQLGGVCVCVLIIILAASVLNSLQKCRIGRECKAWKGRSRGERSSPASLLGESPSKGRERKERGRPCRSPPQPAKRGAMQICRSLPPPPSACLSFDCSLGRGARPDAFTEAATCFLFIYFFAFALSRLSPKAADKT